MTHAFKTLREDGRPEWKVVFDLVQSLEPGASVSHKDLLDALDTTDMGRVYRAVGRANRQLWKSKSKSLGTVRGSGYRVLRADEHEYQADGFRRQARRRMTKAVAVADATDLNQLDSQGREWMTKVQAGLHLLAGAMDQHASKLRKHDDLIKGLQQRVEELERDKP